MHENRKRGKTKVTCGESDDSDGGGNGLPQDLTDEMIQALFAKDKVVGWYLMHDYRRVRISDQCYRGGGGQLTKDEVLDAYQETMAAVYKTIVERPKKIDNIVAYTYCVARRRGGAILRCKVRRERRIRSNDQAVTAAADREEEGEGAIQEAMATINKYLASLEGRSALVAPFLFESNTIEEAAACVGVSPSTFKRAKHELLQELREVLEETEFDYGGYSLFH